MTSLQKIWGCDEEMMEISLKICVSIQMKFNTVGPKTAKPQFMAEQFVNHCQRC